MKYSKQAFLLLLSIIFIHSSHSAQEISQISNKKFHYQGQTYKYQDMGQIFSQNEEANFYFLQATKQRKSARTLGTISAISIGIGTIGWVSALNNNDDFGSVYLGGLTGLVFGAIGISIGIISLGKRGQSKSSRLTSMYIFNKEYGIELLKENPVDVQLVISNGLGIQLKF